VTHSCSTGIGGGGREPESDQESEREGNKEHERAERKKRRRGKEGLLFMRMPTASSAVRGDPAGL